MQFRFQLRTLLLVVTAVALSLGSNEGMRYLRGLKTPSEEWYGLAYLIMNWTSVPHTLVCLLGIKWILEQPKLESKSKAIMLSALVVSVVWRLLGNPLMSYLVDVSSSDISKGFFFKSLAYLVSSIIFALCWLLLILGYLGASRSH